MSALKRKAITDERPSKKARPETKVSDKPAEKEKKPRKSVDSGEKKAIKSILQQEERAFPRGGAEVLSALEKKQISAQAERDVLLEQETGQQLDDGGELFEEAAEAARTKKKRQSGATKDARSKDDVPATRIQGLSYKTLVVGSTVLGRVTAITAQDIALALPNNLTGYVKITSISSKINAKIERLLSDSPADDEDENDVDLKDLFHIGQWLRAIVTATGTDTDDKKSKSKKHIELSIDPSVANGGLSSDNVVVDSTIQAAVRSVEDHGIVMDIGLADDTATGFISKKELGAAYKLSKVQEGQVMFCLVTGKAGGKDRKVLKLSPDFNRLNATQQKPPIVSDAPTVDAFLPGTAVDVLVTESGPRGVVGKIMGMLDVTSDVVHSDTSNVEDMTKRYKIGSKIKARIIYAIPQGDESRKVGISILDHIMALTPAPAKLPDNAVSKLKTQAQDLAQSLPLSSILDDAKVVQVLADRGLFLKITKQSGRDEQVIKAFAHISQISDKHIDSLSSTTGPYKLDTAHRARILSYDPVDNTYYVSLKQSVLDQTFLRLDDLTEGQLVNGTVEKLILGGKTGVTGILVKLSDNVNGLVPEMHLSDTRLQHPEIKFKEGSKVKARVLSVDVEKRQVRLTLKKSLVEDGNASIWKQYAGLEPGLASKGTIINLLDNGAVVQFYGAVRAWLPVAEMSETFIAKPKEHFNLGQTVNVRIVSISAESQEMKVSCKEGDEFTSEQQEAWEAINPGNLVDGTVTEKTADSVLLDMDQGLKAIVRIGHLVDSSESKAEGAMKRIRVGEKLKNLLVLDKQERSHTIILSNKPSMVKDAAKTGKLITKFSDAKPGIKFHGFVRNLTLDSVYAEFANGVVGLITKSQLLPEMSGKPSFGLRKDQTLTVWVTDIDVSRERFLLTMRDPGHAEPSSSVLKQTIGEEVKNPVDPSVGSMEDFTLGRTVKARIASIKATQINIRLADNVQGRVDVSEVFDSWDDITNKAAPLQNDKLKTNDVIVVKILGIHDARSHRFLPISHRQGKVPVFELSAKPSRVGAGDESLLTLDSVKPGASHLAFINNHGDDCVWANLSPNVRGRVALMDLSDDVGQLQNVENRFRVGCALRVKVKTVDTASNRLDLTAKESLKFKDIAPGMVLPARVTRIAERTVTVVIADEVVCHVPLVELSDDYDQASPAQYSKNEIVRVWVVGVDKPNKRAFVSLRPSKVLSSSLPVKDPHIAEVSHLKPGAIVRGFIKQVADKGVFVSLGARVDALVRISDLSDQYVKDWRGIHEVDQLVKGRVVAVDADSKHVQLSLKKSHVDSNYKPPMTINDIQQGMTVTGKVRKVEDFGAFVDIDNTQPRLSGLCHRSEVAAKRIEDVRKHYSSGDVVKAKVLNVDVDNRKISLGLKASYFSNEVDEVDEDESEDEDVDMEGGVEVDDDQSEVDGGVDVDLSEVQDVDTDDGSSVDAMDVDPNDESTPGTGLKTGGFDWTGDISAGADAAAYESDPEITSAKKRKRKPEIKEDRTGDLDKYGPRSDSDFERYLLSQPNNSGLWRQYMEFQLQLSEVQKARDIAERALRTINIRETEEKMHIWVAWLSIEVEYGDDDRIDDVFRRACEVQDPLEMHERLASIYISAGKLDKADGVFEKIVANKTFRASPDVWLNYASFLMNNLNAPGRARALLSRALQSIPTKENRLLTAKFAALEFHSANGDAERGRTIFEGLLSEWSKWSSGWDMWVDLERGRVGRFDGDAEAKSEAIEKTRALYERLSQQKMKKRRAKFMFKKWLEFEEQEGKEKDVERVKALAKDYVEKMAAKGEDDDE